MFQTTMCLAMLCRMINTYPKKEKKEGRKKGERMLDGKGEEVGIRLINSGDDELNKGNYVPFVCVYTPEGS